MRDAETEQDFLKVALHGRQLVDDLLRHEDRCARKWGQRRTTRMRHDVMELTKVVGRLLDDAQERVDGSEGDFSRCWFVHNVTRYRHVSEGTPVNQDGVLLALRRRLEAQESFACPMSPLPIVVPRRFSRLPPVEQTAARQLGGSTWVKWKTRS